MIDLKALSDYQHHLNSRASDRAIREFNRLPFDVQLEVSARWARGIDVREDHAAARDAGDWGLPCQ